MVDIRKVEGRTKKEAMALACIEYGKNFTLLGEKEVKKGGILGIGQRSVYEVRIMLTDPKNDITLIDKKLESDEREMKKHRAIDASEMAERVVSISKNLIENQNAIRQNALNQIQARNEEVYIERQEKTTAEIEISDSKKDDVYGYIDKKMDRFEDKMRFILETYLQNKAQEPMLQKQDQREYSEKPYEKIYSERQYSQEDRITAPLSKRKSSLERDLESMEESRIAQIALTGKRKDKEEVYIDIEDTGNKIKIYGNVIESALENLRRREFPDDAVEAIKEYLTTASNARYIKSERVVREEIERYFDENLLLEDGIQVSNKKKIVVLVGPTGVGKTTTIPKLAATHIRSKRDVHFVTIDNYRIAAEEQLQKYAKIMKVPFTVAKTPEDLRNEVRKIGQNAVLFIDTVGRSPKATRDIVEMSKYFSSIGRFDIDIKLVMSATVKYHDALDILDTFRVANYKGVIITKIDETSYLAPVVSAVMKNRIPISNITYGQTVPNDIAEATKGRSKIIKGLYAGSL